MRQELDFEITAEPMELVDSVRSVLVHECPTALVRDLVENCSPPEQSWKSARALNWTSIDLPESLGGLELGFTALGLVIEQHGGCIAPGCSGVLLSMKQFLQTYRGTISVGASEIQRNIIAQRVLGLPRR